MNRFSSTSAARTPISVSNVVGLLVIFEYLRDGVESQEDAEDGEEAEGDRRGHVQAGLRARWIFRQADKDKPATIMTALMNCVSSSLDSTPDSPKAVST